MKFPLFIAGRYLFARKSHNVINIISAISAAGMAIGTAALIIILSVYNGFDGLVRNSMNTLDPDYLICAREGKVFKIEDHKEAFDKLYEIEEISSICTLLEESVFVNYDNRQAAVRAMGVDAVFEEETRLRDHIRSGQFRLHRGDIPEVCVGAGLAHKLGLNPRFVTPLEIYYPSRTRKPSMANPLNTLNYAKVYPTGTFSVNNDIDQQYIVLPIEKMRELLEYESEVSAVQVRLGFWAENQNIEKKISQIVGEDFVVKDRYRQNENLYKMMKYEKISIWLILVFIIIIIAFNIFGSLSMLIIEKKNDIRTLQFLGMPQRSVRNIFVLEGWLISLLGLGVGLLIGIGFALLQQQFGFIKMPGAFMVSAYPIVIQGMDILVTALSVAVVGYFIAWLPSRASL